MDTRSKVNVLNKEEDEVTHPAGSQQEVQPVVDLITAFHQTENDND